MWHVCGRKPPNPETGLLDDKQKPPKIDETLTKPENGGITHSTRYATSYSTSNSDNNVVEQISGRGTSRVECAVQRTTSDQRRRDQKP